MKIEKEITINKNIESAWKVLGHKFTDVHKWASAVNHSEGKGNGINGAACSERGCDIAGMGKTQEKLIEFSNDKHLLSYIVPEGMPSMIKRATNTWQLISVGTDKSKLHMEMNFTFGGIMGRIIQPMMKMMMSKMGNQMVEEFKYYVENGEAHPRKIKAMKKYRRA